MENSRCYYSVTEVRDQFRSLDSSFLLRGWKYHYLLKKKRLYQPILNTSQHNIQCTPQTKSCFDYNKVGEIQVNNKHQSPRRGINLCSKEHLDNSMWIEGKGMKGAVFEDTNPSNSKRLD